LDVLGKYRDGVFWSVGAGNFHLYGELKEISHRYGFKCMARNGGDYRSINEWAGWMGEIYGYKVEGYSQWHWNSLYGGLYTPPHDMEPTMPLDEAIHQKLVQVYVRNVVKKSTWWNG